MGVIDVNRNSANKCSSASQELNLSFCEIKRDAALTVAEAIEDKAELEKLDLNGT